MPGAKAHIARLKKLSGPQMINAVGKALFNGGEIIQVEAQVSITAGAVSGKGHVASLPGEPPNNDTGVLAGNIRTTQTAPLVVEVSSSAPYAAPLEFGTARMAARPYMTPARDKKRAEVTQKVREAVERVVKRSRGGR